MQSGNNTVVNYHIQPQKGLLLIFCVPFYASVPVITIKAFLSHVFPNIIPKP